MQKIFIPLFLLSISTISIAKEINKTDQILFEKSRKYVEASDSNKTEKKEMSAYIDLTKRLLENGNLGDGLAYMRVKDCVQKHNTGLEVEQLEQMIQKEIQDNNMTEAFKEGKKHILWWVMTMAMKASAGESNKDDIKKMFECGSTSKIVAGMNSKNIQGDMLLSASMPKRTPSSAGDKSIIFENFIRRMLESPIKKLNNAKAIEAGIVPKHMIKNGEIISAEGAKVTLRGVWGNGLSIKYNGVSSTREGRYESPCSRLVTMNSNFGPTIDGKSYPAPDAININRKVFYLHSTSSEQIQEECERKNPAEVIITLRDYTKKEDFMVLKPSEWKMREYKKIDLRHTYSVAVSADRKLYAFGESNDIYIHMRDKELRKVPFFSANYIKFFKDGKTMIAARGRGEVVLIDILTGEMSKPILETKSINAASLSPDEKFLSIVTYKGEFRIIDIENRTTHKVHSMPEQDTRYSRQLSMQSVAYSPDGKTIVMGANSENLIIYDVESDSFKKPIKINNAKSINALVFINNDTLLAGGDRFLAKVDLKAQDYAKYKPLKGRRNINIESMDLSPSGRYLAITGSPTLVYDLKLLKVIDRLGGRQVNVKDLKFISDKKLISATYTKKDAVKFWKFK